MKHTVLYGSARTGDYLIVAIKKLQRVPFPGRHDCRWTAACTNETQKQMGARARPTVATVSLCETSTVQGWLFLVRQAS